MRATLTASIALLAAIVAGRARADSVTLTFAGLRDGQGVTSVTVREPDGTGWIVDTFPPAYAVGPGNAEYTGSPGLDFAGPWTIEHIGGAPALDSVTVTFDLAEPDARPIAVAGVASDTAATPPTSSPPWSWPVASPGRYTEALGGFAGDEITFTATGLWQVPSITIDYTPIATGGGTVPEPTGLALLATAAAGLATAARKKTRPRERPGRERIPGHEPGGERP